MQNANGKNLPQIEKCALWEKTSKRGDVYLSGIAEVDGKVYRIVVFENKFKSANPNRPDYKFDINKMQTECSYASEREN